MDPLPAWWEPGAMALLLVDLQQGTCGDAQPHQRPAFDARLHTHTLPAAGSHATRVIPALAPLADELVLPKSSSSPFSSTTLDYLLRNINIRNLVVIGLLTDQCIDHTVKDFADRGYRVVCLSDACQAETLERHAAALAFFQGYCTQIPVAAFEALIVAQLHATNPDQTCKGKQGPFRMKVRLVVDCGSPQVKQPKWRTSRKMRSRSGGFAQNDIWKTLQTSDMSQYKIHG